MLKRAGLSRIRDIEPAEPVRRYQYDEPGGLIHIDIKTLGRFDKIGHRITGDRTGQSNSRGVTISRVMTDNGSCYKARAFNAACRELGLKHRILLENYFLSGDLEAQIEAFVEHYKHRRYHESLDSATPADAHFGRAAAIIQHRERIKRETIQYRRLQHRKLTA